MSILLMLDEQTGHMGLSLTKRRQEINRRFLQISKLPSARLTQGLPDTERSRCKVGKLRNVLLPPVPVNTSWKGIQGEVSNTIPHSTLPPWTRVWQITSHTECV